VHPNEPCAPCGELYGAPMKVFARLGCRMTGHVLDPGSRREYADYPPLYFCRRCHAGVSVDAAVDELSSQRPEPQGPDTGWLKFSRPPGGPPSAGL
jgi:hypothetical protein